MREHNDKGLPAIKKYRPSSGTEGDRFFANWCYRCQRDAAMRTGCDVDDCDDDERCDIIANTMVYDIEDEEFPKEWIYDKTGQPCCTAFVPAGDPIPPSRDEFTIDMFDDTTTKGKT